MSLTSTINWSGREVGGVVLGEPVVQEDGTFLWDGAGEGVIDADGNITIDQPDSTPSKVGELVATELAPEVIPISLDEKGLGVKKILIEEGKLVATGTRGKLIDLKETLYKEEVPLEEQLVIATPEEELPNDSP